MTIAFVAKTTIVQGANGGTTSPSINTTGANLIIVACTGTTTLPTPTDNKSNTYTALTKWAGTASSQDPGARLFYCLSPTVGSGHTFTVTSSGDGDSFLAYAFSGVSAFDKESGNANATNSAGNGGSFTPTGNNELVFAMAGGDADPNAISDSSGSFSGLTHTGFLAGTAYGIGAAYEIQTTAAAVNPTWTLGSLGGGAGFKVATALAAFTASAAAATTYTITPPTPQVGVRGSASGNFTVTPDNPTSGSVVVTITPSGGGLSTPITKTFTNSATPQTFTITPTSKGVVTLTPSNNGGLTDPAIVSYVSMPKVNLVFDGDSLTYGTNATSGAGTAVSTGTNYPGVVMKQLEDGNGFYTATNLGTTGRRLDTMLSTEAARVQPTYDGVNFDFNVLVVQGGTNDLAAVNDGTHSGAASAATVWSNMVSYVSAAQGYGFLPIIQTITPGDSGTVPANFNALHDQYNDLIRTSWKTTQANAISDTAADSRIGWSGDEANTTYFSASDHVHLTDTGYAIVAGYATQAIQSVLDGATNGSGGGTSAISYKNLMSGNVA